MDTGEVEVRVDEEKSGRVLDRVPYAKGMGQRLPPHERAMCGGEPGQRGDGCWVRVH